MSSPSTTVGGAAPRRSRDDRPDEPEPGGLAQAALEPGHAAQLAEQPDLADRDGPGADRPVAQRRGQRQGQRQVEAGLLEAQPAGEVGVHVMAAETDPGPAAEDRDEQREPVRVDPDAASAAGVP